MKLNSARISLYFTVCLFMLYAVCAFILAIFGARVYERSVVVAEESFNMRTSIVYVTEKIRQGYEQGAISFSTVGEHEAIVLSSEFNDMVFETWIYYDNGYLCEANVIEHLEVLPGTGQQIMPIDGFEVFLAEHGILEIRIEDVKGNVFHSLIDTGNALEGQNE